MSVFVLLESRYDPFIVGIYPSFDDAANIKANAYHIIEEWESSDTGGQVIQRWTRGERKRKWTRE